MFGRRHEILKYLSQSVRKTAGGGGSGCSCCWDRRGVGHGLVSSHGPSEPDELQTAGRTEPGGPTDAPKIAPTLGKFRKAAQVTGIFRLCPFFSSGGRNPHNKNTQLRRASKLQRWVLPLHRLRDMPGPFCQTMSDEKGRAVAPPAGRKTQRRGEAAANERTVARAQTFNPKYGYHDIKAPFPDDQYLQQQIQD